MRIKPHQLIKSMGWTLLLLTILELFSSAFLPALGATHFRLAFHTMIILYFGFRLDVSYLAILILIIQAFHSLFSIEGWAMGTFIGVLLSIVIGYLKDIVNLSTIPIMMIIAQVFQLIWFILASLLFYIKGKDLSLIGTSFLYFIPQSILISIMSPVLFSILEKIWYKARRDSLGA